MHILIAGGTGFIGSSLCKHFKNNNHNISILTRKRNSRKSFHDQVTFLTELTTNAGPFDVIINLAGESLLSKRWTQAFKQTLRESRLNTTKHLTDYIQNCLIKPKVFLSSSAIGFYGKSQLQIFNEDSRPSHQDFTQTLCQNWETAAGIANVGDVRVCMLRFGIVLGKNVGMPRDIFGNNLGGALDQMITPFKFGVGCILGDGQQWMSWIHLEDVVGIIDYLINNEELRGPINLTAPYPVSNKIFSKSLAKEMNRPLFLSMPKWIVKLIFGEMGEALLLSGQNVFPDKILKNGYHFKYPHLKDALKNIFSTP